MARKGIDRARQIAEGLNELEMKVEEATNNDKWGPHGTLMSGAAPFSTADDQVASLQHGLCRHAQEFDNKTTKNIPPVYEAGNVNELMSTLFSKHGVKL